MITVSAIATRPHHECWIFMRCVRELENLIHNKFVISPRLFLSVSTFLNHTFVTNSIRFQFSTFLSWNGCVAIWANKILRNVYKMFARFIFHLIYSQSIFIYRLPSEHLNMSIQQHLNRQFPQHFHMPVYCKWKSLNFNDVNGCAQVLLLAKTWKYICKWHNFQQES